MTFTAERRKKIGMVQILCGHYSEAGIATLAPKKAHHGIDVKSLRNRCMSCQNKYLREVIDEINKIESKDIHRSALEGLHTSQGHHIVMLPGDRHWLDSFNCFAFALGLVDQPDYQALYQRHHQATLADSAFVKGLVEDGQLSEITARNARSRTIVLYFKDGKLKHGGLIEAGSRRIRSKWGLSELYEHGLWEVGASYGTQVRYFAAPDPNRIIALLEDYIGSG
jgi:hypothetical protein